LLGVGGLSPPPFYEWGNLMIKVLSEVNWSDWVGQPIDKLVNTIKKKEPKFLEEQIRDDYPCDVEPKDENNENI
jgi:hypothetical protein|tara:strand:- start:31 stop:252 length:222 start_codon:yes stop_codon:yes gene_type:complete